MDLPVDAPSLEYLAGFFDGEGCVTIQRLRRSQKNPNHNDTYQAVVCVAQTQMAVLEHFQRRWGGPIYAQAPSRNITAKRQLYVWKPSTNSARNFLADIVPWLRVKREQAELGLYLLNVEKGKRSAVGEEIRLRVHELNGNHANFKQ